MNCAFDDTSMSFGTQLEHALRKIFGYRAITDFSYDNNGSHFPKWLPPDSYFINISGSRPSMILILVANPTFSRMGSAVVLFITC